MVKKSNVYVCYTVMHLYISILKVFNQRKINNILILTDHINNYQYFVDKLNKLQIFNKILIVEDKKLSEEFNRRKKNFFFFRKNLITFFNKETCLYNFLNNTKGEIFLFLDEPRTSQYLMLMANHITLVEDGVGLYSVEKFNVKRMIKVLLGIPKTWGKDKRIKTIEATKPNKLPQMVRKKGSLLDLISLQNNISECEKMQLFDIFFNKELCINNNKNILILTQPFSEDLCISEKLKIKIYKNIAEQYIQDYTVYIKPHPRERTDYKKVIDYDFIEIERNFPIELFNIIQFLKFEKVVSVNSSAINNLNCVDEKVELGIEFNKELLIGYRNRFGIK